MMILSKRGIPLQLKIHSVADGVGTSPMGIISSHCSGLSPGGFLSHGWAKQRLVASLIITEAFVRLQH